MKNNPHFMNDNPHQCIQIAIIIKGKRAL